MLHKLIKDKIISCIEVFPHSQLPLIFQDTNRQINPNYNGKLYFNANNLPKSPNQKQYQLWAIVNGKPVDAGLVDATDSDSIFQKMKLWL